ncbi:hypothetical protein ES703_64601 [subsurface metagenome]
MVKIAQRFGSPGREHIVKTHEEPNQRSKKPVSQHTSIPVSQYTGKTAKKGQIKKSQQASKPVRQHTGKPVSQQASKTTSQLTGIRVKRHTGKLTKATFYIYPEQIIDLEKIRLSHLTRKRNKTDKSALVRRAINMLVNQQASKQVGSKEI